MDRSDLVKLLDELELSGQVRREPDPRDRRRHVLSITPAGVKTLSAGEDIISQATEDVLKRLSPEQRTVLHQLTLQALDARD
jgi:DNA-binding MarR family transcriptional regulator